MSTHPLLLNHPRVGLGHWPPALETADRRRAEVGGRALDPDGDVVFVHTGGTPTLHAYAGEWAP